MKTVVLSFMLCVLCVSMPAAAGQRPGQPEVRASALERRIHELINRERAANNLKALEWDWPLSDIARAHSEDMAARNFFSHVNPEGENPTARGDRARYTCRKVIGRAVVEGLAENIFLGHLYSSVLITGKKQSYDWNTADEIAQEAVKGWLQSPGHRQNILSEDFEKTGMGVGISKDDKVYITQMFCSQTWAPI